MLYDAAAGITANSDIQNINATSSIITIAIKKLSIFTDSSRKRLALSSDITAENEDASCSEYFDTVKEINGYREIRIIITIPIKPTEFFIRVSPVESVRALSLTSPPIIGTECDIAYFILLIATVSEECAMIV